jgi:O-antigen/teichoic acid export membrane protein
MGGTLVSQIIPLLLTPVLTRIFSPEDFGAYGVYLAIVMLASILVTGRYDLAILIPKSIKQAFLLAETAFLLSILISILLLIAIVVFSDSIVESLSLTGIGNWLYLLPFSIFLAASIQILTNLKIRTSSYKSLSAARISQTSMSNTFFLCSGTFYKFNGALIVGNLLGQIASVVILFQNYNKSGRFTRNRILGTMKTFSNFPKHLMFAHIINVIAAQMPLLIITNLFGLGAAGFYSIVQRVFGLPSTVLSTSFGEVFKQTASERYKKSGECAELFISTLKKLIYISFIPFLIFYFIAPFLFSFVLGSEWGEAGQYAQILTPMFFIRFISMPLSSIIIFAKKTKIDLYWQVSLLICGACSYFFSSSIEVMITYLSFSFSCCYLMSLYINYRLAFGKGAIKTLLTCNKQHRNSDDGM